MAAYPPSGTVTFLLTDLEGSTRMWEQDPDAMKAAMARHDELLEKAVGANGGYVFARMGDGMATSFPTARDAINAATAIQRSLANEPWQTPRRLRARIGLHTDEGVTFDDDAGGYANLPINRCSRLMSAAHGGQIIISGTTEALVRDHLPRSMRLLDLGEHRLRDLSNATRVFQLSHDGDREEFPPLRTLDSLPGNLPGQVSSFIGRDNDLARVAAALYESRVVTITGVGGVGKTRLALHTAADLLPRYRDGAWLIELAPLRDPAGVTEAVATVFRLAAARGGLSLEDTLVEMLSQKRLLLVLDNCEHLLGPVARLVTRIEQSCPGVRILVTSREGMAIDGEQLIALPPLETGSPDDDVELLAHTDAVSLFVERAQRVKANFALTQDNVRAVIEVCRRLDGVPLAIELAAARVIALSPAELASRLDRRFQVLAGGRRGAVERHATLRAAIDWSYELLSHAEQRLLSRMSVFSGGCTLDAIEEVCSREPVEKDAVIDLVTGLVARSLVIAEDRSLGTRYRILETIRQYGEDRLADCGETGALRIEHARFYADLSAHATEKSYGPDQLVWARQISLETNNIRAALAYAIESGNANLAVRLVAHHPHRQSQSGYPMGEVLFVPAVEVLAVPGARNEPGYSRVLTVAAHQELYEGRLERAMELCREALATERELPGVLHGPRVEMEVSTLQGGAALWSGNYADAVAAYMRAAEIAQTDGAVGIAAIFLAYSVNSAVLGGDNTDETLQRAEQSVALARRSGMPAAKMLSLISLALVLADRDPHRARAVLREGVDEAGTGEGFSGGFLITAGLASGRLHDWDLTLQFAARSMKLDRWATAPVQGATNLAGCARGLAEEQPEVAGVLRGAAYAAFKEANPRAESSSPQASPVEPNANFLLVALRETGDLVTAALGEDRRRELGAEGAAMSADEAVSFALANIDPKLLSGPITF